jgi:hypothetical protein
MLIVGGVVSEIVGGVMPGGGAMPGIVGVVSEIGVIAGSGRTVHVKTCVAFAPDALTAVAVTVYVPVADGIPKMVPFAVAMASPVGRPEAA